MPLQFFITAEETCLQTLNETLSNNTYQTIYYSSNGSLSTGFQIPATAISHFYLTNGWHTLGTSLDSNAYTSIMLSEGVGNCWSVDPSDTTLIVSSCKSSKRGLIEAMGGKKSRLGQLAVLFWAASAITLELQNSKTSNNAVFFDKEQPLRIVNAYCLCH